MVTFSTAVEYRMLIARATGTGFGCGFGLLIILVILILVILCKERVINVHDENTYTEGHVLNLTIGGQAPSRFVLLY